MGLRSLPGAQAYLVLILLIFLALVERSLQKKSSHQVSVVEPNRGHNGLLHHAMRKKSEIYRGAQRCTKMHKDAQGPQTTVKVTCLVICSITLMPSNLLIVSFSGMGSTEQDCMSEGRGGGKWRGRGGGKWRGRGGGKWRGGGGGKWRGRGGGILKGEEANRRGPYQ